MVDKPHCFTVKSNKREKVLISSVGIAPAFNPRKDMNPPVFNQYSAIWDTGATNTVITKRIIDECHLKPISLAQAFTGGGRILTGVYLVNLILPSNISISSIRVTEGDIAGSDVLIGMDIIGLGDFAVTNKDGKTVFTYRMPSIECIDFEELTKRANAGN